MLCVICQKRLVGKADVCEECAKTYGTHAKWIKSLTAYEHPNSYKRNKKILIGRKQEY